MNEEGNKQVFISYKSQNKNIADRICGILESNGYSCWIAPRNETPGKDYGGKIIDVVKKCKVVVLVASSLINKSNHILAEITCAFDTGKPIICYMIEDFEFSSSLEYRLNNKHRIFATDLKTDYGKILLDSVKKYIDERTDENRDEENSGTDNPAQEKKADGGYRLVRTGLADWGDAPPHMDIFGRREELAWLNKKSAEGVKIFCLVGTGGIGKSTLARNWADAFVDESDAVIWISFKNRPDPLAVFRKICQLLVPECTIPLKSVFEHIDDLIGLLTYKKAIIILDNMESIMKSGDETGEFIEGFSYIERFLKRFADITTQSNVLLTTRELPNCIEYLANSHSTICRFYNLPGLDKEAVKQIVAFHGLTWKSEENLEKFSEHHGGSPYAITLASSTVLSDYGGVIDSYVESASKLPSKLIKLLDTQIVRLSALQKTILYLLAVERVPVSLQGILDSLIHSYFEDEIKDALSQLRHKSLLEPVNENGCYYIQNVLCDYATDQICKEMTGCIINVIKTKEMSSDDLLLRDLHIITATASHEIREAQMRTLVKPIYKNVSARFGAARVRPELYNAIRSIGSDPSTVGFAVGTLVTMMLQTAEELNGLDLSETLLWSCDFEFCDLIDTDFRGSDLRLSRFREVLDAVSCVAFGKDNDEIFFGTSDGKIHVQNLKENSLSAKKIHSGYVRGMAYDRKNGSLLTVGEDRKLHVLDPENLLEKEVVETENHSLRFVSLSKEGRRIYGGDGGLIVQSDGNRILREECPDSGIVRDGCFQGEETVAFVTENGLVKCGGFMTSPSEMKSIVLENQSLWCITPIEKGYLVAGKQGKIVMLDENLNRTGPDFEGANSPIWHIVSGNNYYVAATSIGALLFFDKTTGMIRYRIAAHENWIRALSVSADGNYLISGSADQSVKIFKESTRELRFDLAGESLNFLAVADTGRSLVAGGTDGLLHCWDHASCKPRRIHRPYNAWVRALSYSSAADCVAIGYGTGAIELWDLKKDKFVQIGVHPGGDVWALDFHPEFPMFLSAGEDGKVLQWNKDSLGNWNYREVYDFGKWAIECKYSSDGKKIACGDALGHVAVIDGASVEDLPLQERPDQAWGIAWSKDDKHIVVAERSAMLRFWQIGEGKPVCVSVPSESANWDVAFTEDGTTAAAVGDRGYITFARDNKIKVCKLSEGRLQAVAPCKEKNAFVAAGDDGIVLETDLDGNVTKRFVPDRQYSRLKVENAINVSDFQLSSIRQFGGID